MLNDFVFKMTDRSETMESDSFFRSIDQDDFDSHDGDVESPTGWFGLVRIDPTFRNAPQNFTTVPASVDDGLYLVQINERGLVWAYQTFDGDEAHLRFNFNELVKEYSDWSHTDDDALEEALDRCAKGCVCGE